MLQNGDGMTLSNSGKTQSNSGTAQGNGGPGAAENDMALPGKDSEASHNDLIQGDGTSQSASTKVEAGSEPIRPTNANGSNAGGLAAANSFAVEPCKLEVKPSGSATADAVSVFKRTVQPQGEPLTGIKAISVRRLVDEAGYGYRFGTSYALASDGTLFTWGLQDFASITETMDFPARVEGMPAITATDGRFALDATGQVWLVAGDKTPRKLSGLDRVKRIRQSNDNRLAVLKEDGTAWTWELVYKYEIGKGDRWEEVLTQADVTNVADIFAGMRAPYFLKSDGTLAAASVDGNAAEPAESAVIELPEGAKIVRAEGATDFSSLFLLADSGDWFHYNEYTKELQRLAGLQGAMKVTGGSDYNLALLRDGTVRGWGSNRDMLAPGRMDQEDFPSLTSDIRSSERSVPIGGLTDIVDIQAGSDHALALRRDGTVLSWGSNSYGQLGRSKHWAGKLTEVGTLEDGATLIKLGFEGLTFLKDGDVYRMDGDGRLMPWVIGQQVIKAPLRPEGLFLTKAGQLIVTQYQGTDCQIFTAQSPIRDINEDGYRTLLARLDNGRMIRVTLNGFELKPLELRLPSQSKPARLYSYPIPVALTEDGALYAAVSMSDTETELKRVPGLPKLKSWGAQAPAYFDLNSAIGYALGEDGAVYEVTAKLPEGTQYDMAAPLSFQTKQVQTGIAALYGGLTISGSGRLHEERYRDRFDDTSADVRQIRYMLSSYNFGIEGPGSLWHAAVTNDGRVLWLGDMPFQRLSAPPAPVTTIP
ncbi:hypothetical protein SD70_22220 [Gordoniibacillus kamchatkensis]|uniref:Uncharacterized protein n=2 Tax=Gordoniibacillus kamchatkensis TaxID=1590651 RepID=A0ABR5ADL5_9BACL|nr:hypothetical protein SD70_22220 [Paenibacillus sp. VKM B-2647]